MCDEAKRKAHMEEKLFRESCRDAAAAAHAAALDNESTPEAAKQASDKAFSETGKYLLQNPDVFQLMFLDREAAEQTLCKIAEHEYAKRKAEELAAPVVYTDRDIEMACRAILQKAFDGIISDEEAIEEAKALCISMGGKWSEFLG